MGATPSPATDDGAREKAWVATYCVAIANLADLDFIWWNGSGFSVSGLFHHGVTHSFGFALIVAAVAGAVARLRGRKDYARLAILTAVLYSSHVLADILNEDLFPVNGVGLPALWPLTDTYFTFPILPGITRETVFTLSNAKAIALEALFFGGIMIAVWWRRLLRNRAGLVAPS